MSATPALAEEAASPEPTDDAPLATVQASTTPAQELAGAQQEQAAATDAVTAAQNDVSAATAAKNAADLAVTAAEGAKQALSDAQKASDAADQKAASAKSSCESAQRAADDAGKTAPPQSQVDSAKQAADSAKATYDADKKASDAANKSLSGAQADAKAKADAAAKATKDVSSAKSAYETAQQKADAVDTAALQAKVDEAQRAYDAIPGTEKLTAMEFMNKWYQTTLDDGTTVNYQQHRNSIPAEDIYFTDEYGNKAVHVGYVLDDSSVSYESLLAGCDIMDAVNAERVKYGHAELPVSPHAVGEEMIEADINDNPAGPYDHTGYDSNEARCLAWPGAPEYAVPAWMREKAEYDRLIKEHPEAATYSYGGISAYFPDEIGEVGHYMLLMEDYFVNQGAGWGSNGRYKAAAWGCNGNLNGDEMTVAQWRQAIIDARDAKDSPEKEAARRTLEAAKKSLADEQTLIADAATKKTAYENAQRRLAQAQSERDAADAAVAAAESRAKAAAGKLSESKAAYQRAKGNYDRLAAQRAKYTTAQRKANEAKAAYQRAAKSASDAKSKLADARDACRVAQAALPALRADAASAAKTLSDAKARLKTAKSGLDSANARLTVAKAAYDQATSTVELYRCYNPASGEHLYTTHKEEVDHLVGVGWNWEKDQTRSLPATSGTPVWRVYNPATQDHHYTSDAHEYRVLTTQQGWVADFSGQPAFYSAGKDGMPFYRMRTNPYVTFGHLYSADANEKDTLFSRGGWVDEGIGWYAARTNATQATSTAKATVRAQRHYAVRYDANGGSGHMASTVVAMGTSARLSANAYERPGYTFRGWSASKNGSVAYADRASVKNLSAKDGGVVTLYAVWRKR